ncbi:hypothetical protein CALVIDRAFT_567651 [Calocera viscosa TUFC12733]|uniref:Restriction of telomere capping protein 4 C-terminal domain-containing protein n=1 Tax=Calocera viscosa (strain TUFC12733) TaxID=1330018 RepID=A0A167HX34_CALVF|nr:hypothetical protein CALVIDRAFT_567651 [Calocera viscosa TUFC12733]
MGRSFPQRSASAPQVGRNYRAIGTGKMVRRAATASTTAQSRGAEDDEASEENARSTSGADSEATPRRRSARIRNSTRNSRTRSVSIKARTIVSKGTTRVLRSAYSAQRDASPVVQASSGDEGDYHTESDSDSFSENAASSDGEYKPLPRRRRQLRLEPVEIYNRPAAKYDRNIKEDAPRRSKRMTDNKKKERAVISDDDEDEDDEDENDEDASGEDGDIDGDDDFEAGDEDADDDYESDGSEDVDNTRKMPNSLVVTTPASASGKSDMEFDDVDEVTAASHDALKAHILAGAVFTNVDKPWKALVKAHKDKVNGADPPWVWQGRVPSKGIVFKKDENGREYVVNHTKEKEEMPCPGPKAHRNKQNWPTKLYDDKIHEGLAWLDSRKRLQKVMKHPEKAVVWELRRKYEPGPSAEDRQRAHSASERQRAKLREMEEERQDHNEELFNAGYYGRQGGLIIEELLMELVVDNPSYAPFNRKDFIHLVLVPEAVVILMKLRFQIKPAAAKQLLKDSREYGERKFPLRPQNRR